MRIADPEQQAPISREMLINEALSAYVAWREACVRVEDAWERWIAAPSQERALAIALYESELEGEARAARRYELLLAEGATREAHGAWAA
jgi:hypothetical protein